MIRWNARRSGFLAPPPLGVLPGFLAGFLALAACGSTADNLGGSGRQRASGGAGPGSGSGTFGGNSGGSDPGGDQCAAQSIQATNGLVDIIFVIDDSGSMTEEMNQVKTNINNFASTIGGKGLDYHVIMITLKGTAGNTICVPPPLADAACANKPPNFAHIDLDVDSHNSLSIILSSYDSWKAHLRPDATKTFIEVTDDESEITSETFEAGLFAKPDGMFGTATNRKYNFNSICGWQEGTPFGSATLCTGAVQPGLQYQKLSQLTGGLIDSVCKTSYATVLDNFAKTIAQKLACDFQIPKATTGTIDPTTVAVNFTPGGGTKRTLTQVTDASKCAANPNAWHYDNNAAPSRIKLCASTCAAVSSDTAGKIDLLVGCKTPAPR